MIDDNIAELLHIYDQPVYIPDVSAISSLTPKGGFGKQVLVLVKEDDLNASNEMLLAKMLAACQLNESDYYIISSTQDVVLPMIHRFMPETVLLFGLDLHSDTFDSLKDKYNPFRFGGKKFLLCDSLTSISNAPTLKAALWTNGLKPLFNIP
jgi:DNA polymerase III psi subunit